MFDPKFALDVMLPLAEAAYDLSKLPKGWGLIAPIQPDNFGFVAQSSQAVIISFRGTEQDCEWREDFDALAVPNQYGKGMVHRGFQEQYSKIRASVIVALSKANTHLPLWITGHSLGAALATLCQADLAPVHDPLCYTWAGPRVGWIDFANWFDSLNLECYRIVNEWDLVPQVPPVLLGYKFQGQQILIDGGKPPLEEDHFRIAHSLELSYRPGMERSITGLPKAA